MLLALSVFVPTLILVMARPRPFSEATAALLGALLMVITGVVMPAQVWQVLRASANVLLFFLGLMVVSAIADRGGFFEWSAVKAARQSHGSGRALLLVVFGLGAVITAFFSNDATALILTPTVYALVSRLKLNPLPFVFACAFVANTASTILPVSNPVNVLPVDRFGITLSEYLRFLLLPSILAVSINLALFLIIFRKHLGSFHDDCTRNPVKVDSFFVFVCVGLAITALGYVLSSLYGLPLSLPAMAGAAILLAGSLASRRVSLHEVSSRISWSILPFIFALALLVRGLENAGVISWAGRLPTWRPAGRWRQSCPRPCAPPSAQTWSTTGR